jgi:hypothetical protein
MGEMRNSYKNLAVKLATKKSLGRCKSRRKDGIKMDAKGQGIKM